MIAAILLAGCETNHAIEPTWVARPWDQGSPTVMVNGAPLDARALQERTAELAGGIAIEELVLERALDEECRRRGVVVGPEGIHAERAALVDAVVGDRSEAGASAVELLERIRAERGLGPVRFEALLRRNAMLRALVGGSVRVEPSEIRLAHEMSEGARAEVRLIVVPTREDAGASLARVLEASTTLGVVQAFADEARRVSIHASAPTGGAMGVISPADPALPGALGAQLNDREQGSLTGIVPMGSNWAFALTERVIERTPAAEPSPERAEAIAEEIRRRKERLEMERLAERLVHEADVNVIDPSLGWSYRVRAGGGR